MISSRFLKTLSCSGLRPDALVTGSLHSGDITVSVLILLMKVNICDSLRTECFIPAEALRVEGQATKNLCAFVELPHVGSRYHGAAAAVHGSVVVHTWTVTHCDTKMFGVFKNENSEIKSVYYP